MKLPHPRYSLQKKIFVRLNQCPEWWNQIIRELKDDQKMSVSIAAALHSKSFNEKNKNWRYRVVRKLFVTKDFVKNQWEPLSVSDSSNLWPVEWIVQFSTNRLSVTKLVMKTKAGFSYKFSTQNCGKFAAFADCIWSWGGRQLTLKWVARVLRALKNSWSFSKSYIYRNSQTVTMFFNLKFNCCEGILFAFNHDFQNNILYII